MLLSKLSIFATLNKSTLGITADILLSFYKTRKTDLDVGLNALL